ncbi:BQ5605_C021g09282 [Microbotryum silenes-dioicae]|uniref:BQ5605_C021g09282 protein n=1 Tax=Microbotryum silenes-dioicae TaxID=796604 RepID=A0A2X0N645_9BASI|nr:BQ5605_C021g09282 [Microbotryum silenes-dioicae]
MRAPGQRLHQVGEAAASEKHHLHVVLGRVATIATSSHRFARVDPKRNHLFHRHTTGTETARARSTAVRVPTQDAHELLDELLRLEITTRQRVLGRDAEQLREFLQRHDLGVSVAFLGLETAQEALHPCTRFSHLRPERTAYTAEKDRIGRRRRRFGSSTFERRSSFVEGGPIGIERLWWVVEFRFPASRTVAFLVKDPTVGTERGLVVIDLFLIEVVVVVLVAIVLFCIIVFRILLAITIVVVIVFLINLLSMGIILERINRINGDRSLLRAHRALLRTLDRCLGQKLGL